MTTVWIDSFVFWCIMGRIMHVFRTIALAGILTIAVSTARSEPGLIGQWLMNEPLTLLDWGIYQARKSAEDAATEMQDSNLLMTYAAGYAEYDWDNNEIEIWLYADSHVDVTHDHCNIYRQTFLTQHLLSEARGSSMHHDRAVKQVDEWFSHEGFKRSTRPEDLAEKLARIIWVRVTFVDDIECKARITEWDAPSKPLGN